MSSPVVVKFIFFGLLILGVIFEVMGDIFWKKWTIENKLWFFVVGLIIYFIGSIFWAVTLKYEAMSKAIVIFTVLNSVILVGIGVFFFKENLSLVNKIGIGLGLISVILAGI